MYAQVEQKNICFDNGTNCVNVVRVCGCMYVRMHACFQHVSFSLGWTFVMIRARAATVLSATFLHVYMYVFYPRLNITSEPDTSCKYVIKKVFIGSESILEKSSKLRETQLLAMIRHPYIVQV
jgi:hypothetical protein